MGEDPRRNPAPVSEVPDLLQEGARRFDAGRFWDAHEAWEDAWHALRGADHDAEAAFVQGLILAAAALENLREGHGDGFRRQMAQGLHQLRENRAAGTRLGFRDDPSWIDELVGFYLDGVRRTAFAAWMRDAPAPPPLGGLGAARAPDGS